MFFDINKIVFNSDKINGVQATIFYDTYIVSMYTDTHTVKFYLDSLDNLQAFINPFREDLKTGNIKQSYTFAGVIGTDMTAEESTTCFINEYYAVNMTKVTSLIEWTNQVQIGFDNGEFVLFEGPSAHELFMKFRTDWYGSHTAFKATFKDLTCKIENVLNQSRNQINVNSSISGDVKASVSGELSVNANAGMGDFCVLPMDTFGNVLG